jgi:phenylacetyl-CoA:acceptor oxidoreductase subunit 1
MTRWVMLADLERCVGCQTCTAACRHANATSPAVQWRKVLDLEAGSFPNVTRTFVPVGCQHCADPPCMHVCPTTATRQRPDGIVTIDYEICIGCAYCEVACPYQARFLEREPHYAYGPAMQNESERFDDARLGVAQKCSFCSDRIDFGVANGLEPGTDPRATPACVNACIADALAFGDLDDPRSKVSRLVKEQKHFRMHEELKTEPGFYYLYDKANEAEGRTGLTDAEQAGRVRTRGVEPEHQKHWDWKAAGNFLCGGAGTGLLAFAMAAGWSGAPVVAPVLVALAIVALGLSLLIFKIGRPLRAIYVIRQPQRSWMSREAWVAPPLFALALAGLWFENKATLAGGAAVGLIFLFCQAMMLREARGIPVWRAASIVPLMLATGLTEGGGLFLAGLALMPGLASVTTPASIAVLLFLALRLVAWRVYLNELITTGAPTRTLDVLSAFRLWFLGLNLAAVILIALGLGAMRGSALLLALGGLTAFAAGWALKFVIIRRAAYNQGFALTHTPVRGAGIAGPGVKPGWTMP